ncbi:hypothetical protein HJG60_011257 [Phyllostomus discolor]|uniref:Uncharacterized protein n=1 Tax=Phyllostomus discolor TaxID=89673 RepID=A0A834A487_9CHIR|nr:hypothetical protein HJG60_011257 [Phyllostomus discolor]
MWSRACAWETRRPAEGNSGINEQLQCFPLVLLSSWNLGRGKSGSQCVFCKQTVVLLCSSGNLTPAGQTHGKVWSWVGRDWETWMWPGIMVKHENIFLHLCKFDACLPGYLENIYCHVPCNDISVNDGLHKPWSSCKIIMELKNSYCSVTL